MENHQCYRDLGSWQGNVEKNYWIRIQSLTRREIWEKILTRGIPMPISARRASLRLTRERKSRRASITKADRHRLRGRWVSGRRGKQRQYSCTHRRGPRHRCPRSILNPGVCVYTYSVYRGYLWSATVPEKRGKIDYHKPIFSGPIYSLFFPRIWRSNPRADFSTSGSVAGRKFDSSTELPKNRTHVA